MPQPHLFLQGLKTSPKAQPRELSSIFCKKHEVVSGIPGEQTWRMRHPRRLSQVKITLVVFPLAFPKPGLPKPNPKQLMEISIGDIKARL